MNNEGLYMERTEGKRTFQNAEILFPKPVSHPLKGIFVLLLFSVWMLEWLIVVTFEVNFILLGKRS